MKSYRSNSPEAMARILAMTMLADARLDDRELATMERLQIYEMLGVSKSEFAAIVSDYCSDLVRSSAGKPTINLMDSQRIDAVTDAVDDPEKRILLARVILNLMKADGHFSDTEVALFGRVMHRWNLSMSDLTA